MKIVQKIKNIFKKPEPVLMKPPEIKVTTIPTEHLRAKVLVPYNLFFDENPEELELQAKNMLMRELEPVIKNRLNIYFEQTGYREPFVVTADIFIGFGGECR